jgi:hypothetical protein
MNLVLRNNVAVIKRILLAEEWSKLILVEDLLIVDSRKASY